MPQLKIGGKRKKNDMFYSDENKIEKKLILQCCSQPTISYDANKMAT